MRMRKAERKKWKWSLGLALAVAVCLAVPVGVHAEGTVQKEDIYSQNIGEEFDKKTRLRDTDNKTSQPYVKVANWSTERCAIPSDYDNTKQDVFPECYGECATSFLGQLDGGGFQTVIYYSGKLYVQNYDSIFQPTKSLVLNLELPIWGGFYFGETYNYVICGNIMDSEAENGGEVYRIIKYDKEFNRMGSLSLNSQETYTEIPFAGGNVAVAEKGTELTIYTSRERLDGHQSNIAIHVNVENIQLLSTHGLEAFPAVHVGHSMRQIVKYDGDVPIYADLSDGYPLRSVYVQGEKIKASVLDIAGEIGYNYTDAELSGMAITSKGYLLTGSYLNYEDDNIFLVYMDKETGEVTKRWLTDSTIFEKNVCTILKS